MRDEEVARISPLGYVHRNVLGRDTVERDQAIQQGTHAHCAQRTSMLLVDRTSGDLMRFIWDLLLKE